MGVVHGYDLGIGNIYLKLAVLWSHCRSLIKKGVTLINVRLVIDKVAYILMEE